MQRVSNGYTIVEVMIFLAVSAALLGAAMNLISGKQSETQFNQKMRDTQSQIQDWLNDVSTGNPGGDLASQSCVVGPGNKPLVQSIAPTSTYTPSCTYLGKAIQFTDQSYSTTQDESLYTYTVFGCRISGCAAAGDYPDDLSSANPSPVVGQGGATGVNMTDTFSLSPAHVKSVCSVNVCTPTPSQSTQSHLIGFFSTFNTEQTALQNGSSDLNVYTFKFDGTAGPAQPNSAVTHCLELTGLCSSPLALNNYQVCLTDGQRTAQITISSSNGIGVSTKLDYVAC